MFLMMQRLLQSRGFFVDDCEGIVFLDPAAPHPLGHLPRYPGIIIGEKNAG